MNVNGYFTPNERTLLIGAMEHARDVKRGEVLMHSADPDAWKRLSDETDRLTRLIAKLKAMH